MAGPPNKGGLSLYDNLQDPNDSSSSATISSAPVLYNQNETPSESTQQRPINPALRFQPIRRPQAKQSIKPKPSFPKTIPKSATPVGSNSTATATPTSTTAPAAAPAKSTLADWAATEEDEWMYGTGEKRQRGGRRNKKKKHQNEHAETDWNELYDPARPTNVDEYLKSDEKLDEIREWKSLLYHHRRNPDESQLSDDDEDSTPAHVNQFAPPPSYNAFAPPPPPPASRPDNNLEDVAMLQGTPPPPPPPPQDPSPPSSPSNSAIISRAPVRYTQPTQDEDEAMNDHPGLGSTNQPPQDATRTKAPGQAGFAARLMSKYGWTAGTGLGAEESGIVNPLRVQVDKRRRKADADGGGWAEPAGKGKIIGSKRAADNTGKFGVMSEVILLQNMLENMPDLEAEIADGLGQEIGEECGEKYGRVERLYIDQTNRQVFIKFTNQVSALRAVNELDGRVFNGNTIMPKFYDVERFEKGIYT